MYSIKSILTGIKYPSKIVSELNRVFSLYRYETRYYPDGMDIFQEDWDQLIVLDACRFDEYQRFADFPGTLEQRTSRGSTTHQFIRGNFSGRNLYDIVYVSANGWFANLKNEIDADIHDFIPVDRDAVNSLTSQPETVTETALDVADEYPNKRLIIHFMQPHQPYLGPTGQEIEHDGALYQTMTKNNLSRDEVINAYRENLVLVLDEVERLLEEFSGLTVITADHGELLGEWQRPLPTRYYGHPDGVYVDELLTVPWHAHQEGERKEIIAERPIKGEDQYDQREVDEQLRLLGYKP